MIERVSKLHVIENASPTIGEDSLLGRIEKFIGEELIDLSGDYEADVELEMPHGDEQKLGLLTAFEKKAFVLATLLEQRIQDLLVEIEAMGAETITRIMREQRVSFMQAMQQHMPQMPVDQRAELNRHAITHTNIVTLYDWSVRQRYDEWTKMLIVRTGFTVYRY